MAVLTKITSRSLADNAVSSAKIQDGAIAVADVADGSISTAKLADDAVTTAKIVNDAVTAAKIPAGAVVADVGAGGITDTQLATNAVTTVKIANDAVNADKLASNAVVSASIVDANITAAKLSSTALATVEHVKPHIKYGWLYPSLKDTGGVRRLSDGVAALVASTVGPAGSTIASSLYGTVQADGKMYYYTDIKGSKPIKDPRIGAHFGSQRHKFKSLQKLEQETATSGVPIFSVDGREWVRAYSINGGWQVYNDEAGNYIRATSNSTGCFLEFTGYFNDINFLLYAWSNRCDDIDISVNGTLTVDGSTTLGGDIALNSPIAGRYIDSGSLLNGGSILSASLGTTPTINTIRYECKTGSGEYLSISGIELIAQHRGSNTGSDIAPNNSATSMGSLTEANATTGWTNTSFNTFESAAVSAAGGTPPTGVGTYALHLVATANQQYCGTGAITTVVGTRYRVTFHYKVTNGDADSYIELYGGTAAGNGNIFGERTFPDSEWHSHDIEFTATTTSFFLTLQETGGAGNDPNIYIAGITFFALTDTELSQIQIPPQNVVSYGKKFAVGITQSATGTDKKALHYNPFAFKTDGTTAWASGAHNGTSWPVGTGSSHNIDTGTSLGLSKWLHSSNYYKPYNGGRVVVWVDSSGNIKTSVTVMPPNARSVATSGTLSGAVAKTNASIANNQYKPTFEAGAMDDFPTTALSEVAKTFDIREFGNGAANTGTAGAHADATMLAGVDEIAHIMDDGLTGFSAQDAYDYQIAGGSAKLFYLNTTNKAWHMTFIGTGISTIPRKASVQGPEIAWAQNLPYGTHFIKTHTDASTHALTTVTVDGIVVHTGNDVHISYGGIAEATFHQPKMPPIPENAIVLADYMLMADHVQQTDAETTDISKGVRYCNATREHFYSNAEHSSRPRYNFASQYGMCITGGTGSNHTTSKLPFFGTLAQVAIENSAQISGTGSLGHHMLMNGKATTETALDCSTTDRQDQIVLNTALNTPTSGASDAVPLGLNTVTTQQRGGGYQLYGHFLVCPIHTSSHYQSFETPYLHELVGGDRNMEQNNLVVTADGKSWDEVTRDTSYIGNVKLVVKTSVNQNPSGGIATVAIPTRYRGTYTGVECFNKDIAIAYNRWIILKDGQYTIDFNTLRSSTGNGEQTKLAINGVAITQFYSEVANYRTAGHIHTSKHLQRGDYIQIFGTFWDGQHGTLTVSGK